MQDGAPENVCIVPDAANPDLEVYDDDEWTYILGEVPEEDNFRFNLEANEAQCLTGISGEYGQWFIASVGYTFDLTLPAIPVPDPVVCPTCPVIDVPDIPSAVDAVTTDPPETVAPEVTATPLEPEKTYIEIDAKKIFIAVIVISAVFGCVIFGIIAYCIGRCCASAFVDDEARDETIDQQEQQPLPNESIDVRGREQRGVYYPGDDDTGAHGYK